MFSKWYSGMFSKMVFFQFQDHLSTYHHSDGRKRKRKTWHSIKNDCRSLWDERNSLQWLIDVVVTLGLPSVNPGRQQRGARQDKPVLNATTATTTTTAATPTRTTTKTRTKTRRTKEKTSQTREQKQEQRMATTHHFLQMHNVFEHRQS